MLKVHKSAICLVPPRAVWPQIQEIRCFNDKSFVRWPPHVNLLYPFVEDRGANFAAAASRCSEALRTFSNFQVKLRSLSFFEHGRSCTLWVDPESEDLCQVQAALVEAFPDCTDLSNDPSRSITRFTPHLSLGQWRSQAAVVGAVQQYSASWRPVEFEAGGVALISRKGFDDPFTIRYLVPFGGSPAQQVDLPYVATVAGQCSPGAASTAALTGSQQEPLVVAHSPTDDFGLGCWREAGGVYNLAYGANMCPSKLEGARGLRPLDSVPARLPGWRLSFTHRGGMGNLVRVAPGGNGADAPPSVHGVLHRLSHADYQRLAGMEHEYRPEVVEVERYDGQGCQQAVIFVTPHECTIRDGLPPPTRYLELLKEGARHWSLDAGYTRWLEGLPSIDSRQRGEEYYTSRGGRPLSALPKIRTGSQQQQQRRGGGGERRRGQRAGGRRAAAA